MLWMRSSAKQTARAAWQNSYTGSTRRALLFEVGRTRVCTCIRYKQVLGAYEHVYTTKTLCILLVYMHVQ